MKWKIVTIKSISKQIRGVSYTPKDVSSFPLEGHIRLLRANNITESGIDLSDTVFVNQKCISESQKLKVGDILIAASSGSIKIVGKAILIEDEINSSFGAFCKVIRPSENVDYRYLSYYFRSSDYRQKISHLAAGANINNLRNEDLDNLEIPLPPLSTQKRIAEILDAADALRRKDQELLRKYDELAQAIFIDMFGDPVKNEKGWEVKKLDKIGKLDRGVSKHRPRNAPELLGGIYPLIQTGDVANSNGVIENYKATYSEIGLKQSKLWGKGTLCITIAANIAKTGILNFDACFPDSIVGFTPNEKLSNTIYVQFWLSFLQKMLEETAPESAQKNINLEILRNLDIICPPIELQKSFAAKVLNIRNQKKLFDNNQSHYLFDSLLQQAFKGELVK